MYRGLLHVVYLLKIKRVCHIAWQCMHMFVSTSFHIFYFAKFYEMQVLLKRLISIYRYRGFEQRAIQNVCFRENYFSWTNAVVKRPANKDPKVDDYYYGPVTLQVTLTENEQCCVMRKRFQLNLVLVHLHKPLVN